MPVIVEEYVNRKKLSYDLMKFHRSLVETLMGKGILSEEDIKKIYSKSS